MNKENLRKFKKLSLLYSQIKKTHKLDYYIELCNLMNYFANKGVCKKVDLYINYYEYNNLIEDYILKYSYDLEELNNLDRTHELFDLKIKLDPKNKSNIIKYDTGLLVIEFGGESNMLNNLFGSLER